MQRVNSLLGNPYNALRRFWCEGEGFYKNIFCEGEAAFFGCDRAAEGRRTAAQGGGSSAEVALIAAY